MNLKYVYNKLWGFIIFKYLYYTRKIKILVCIREAENLLETNSLFLIFFLSAWNVEKSDDTRKKNTFRACLPKWVSHEVL